MTEIKNAIEHITSLFREPLEAQGVSIPKLQDEVEDGVDYSSKYRSIETTNYRKVWYNLHVCPDASLLPNTFLLCELVFSLPFSNGRVEQIFSSLKIIKTQNRTSMSISTLDDLIEIFVEGPPLTCFSPEIAVELWWADCSTTRRVNQGPRKSYRPRSGRDVSQAGPSTEQETESEDHMILNDWDEWFHSSDQDYTDESSDDDQ